MNTTSAPLDGERSLAEHAAETSRLLARIAAGARIDDAATATTAATPRLTRAQILQQAAASLRTQSNGMAPSLLSLLR